MDIFLLKNERVCITCIAEIKNCNIGKLEVTQYRRNCGQSSIQI